MAASFQIFLGYVLVGFPWLHAQIQVHFPPSIQDLLIKVSLADLVLPFFCCAVLWRLGPSLPKKMWPGVSLYAIVAVSMLVLHRSREDLAYWLGQVFQVAIYLSFFLMGCKVGVAVLARQIVKAWAVMTPLLWAAGVPGLEDESTPGNL